MLGRALGAGSPDLVRLVAALHPPGSDPLVCALVEAAVDKAVPTVQLMAACREWYAASGDVKVYV